MYFSIGKVVLAKTSSRLLSWAWPPHWRTLLVIWSGSVCGLVINQTDRASPQTATLRKLNSVHFVLALVTNQSLGHFNHHNRSAFIFLGNISLSLSLSSLRLLLGPLIAINYGQGYV